MSAKRFTFRVLHEQEKRANLGKLLTKGKVPIPHRYDNPYLIQAMTGVKLPVYQSIALKTSSRPKLQAPPTKRIRYQVLPAEKITLRLPSADDNIAIKNALSNTAMSTSLLKDGSFSDLGLLFGALGHYSKIFKGINDAEYVKPEKDDLLSMAQDAGIDQPGTALNSFPVTFNNTTAEPINLPTGDPQDNAVPPVNEGVPNFSEDVSDIPPIEVHDDDGDPPIVYPAQPEQVQPDPEQPEQEQLDQVPPAQEQKVQSDSGIVYPEGTILTSRFGKYFAPQILSNLSNSSTNRERAELIASSLQPAPPPPPPGPPKKLTNAEEAQLLRRTERAVAAVFAFANYTPDQHGSLKSRQYRALDAIQSLGHYLDFIERENKDENDAYLRSSQIFDILYRLAGLYDPDKEGTVKQPKPELCRLVLPTCGANGNVFGGVQQFTILPENELEKILDEITIAKGDKGAEAKLDEKGTIIDAYAKIASMVMQGIDPETQPGLETLVATIAKNSPNKLGCAPPPVKET